MANLYLVDMALAVESDCGLRLLSLVKCLSRSTNEGSSAIASARSMQEGKEGLDTGIDITDSTSGTAQVITENDAQNNNGGKKMDPEIVLDVDHSVKLTIESANVVFKLKLYGFKQRGLRG